jgi:ABC-type transporter Mla MlaB component
VIPRLGVVSTSPDLPGKLAVGGISYPHAARQLLFHQYSEEQPVEGRLHAAKSRMLRITALAENGTETLRLEGKLLAPWVAELEQACAQAQTRSPRVYLDLALVSFVDATGVCSLRALLRQGIALAACSGFVAETLGRRDSDC